jgi:hypothetical protein
MSPFVPGQSRFQVVVAAGSTLLAPRLVLLLALEEQQRMVSIEIWKNLRGAVKLIHTTRHHYYI